MTSEKNDLPQKGKEALLGRYNNENGNRILKDEKQTQHHAAYENVTDFAA